MLYRPITLIIVFLIIYNSSLFAQENQQRYSTPNNVEVKARKISKSKNSKKYYETKKGELYTGDLLITHYKSGEKNEVVQIDSVHVIKGFERGWKKIYKKEFSDTIPAEILYLLEKEEYKIEYNKSLYIDSNKLETWAVEYVFRRHDIGVIRFSLIFSQVAKTYHLMYMKRYYNDETNNFEQESGNVTFDSPFTALEYFVRIAFAKEMKEAIEQNKHLIKVSE